MSVGLLLVVIGIIVAFLVNWALGVVLILVGIALLAWQSGGLRL